MERRYWQSDIATGCAVRQGVCHYPDVPGNGVTLIK